MSEQGQKANIKGEVLRGDIAHLLYSAGRMQSVPASTISEFRQTFSSPLTMQDGVNGIFAEEVCLGLDCFSRKLTPHFVLQARDWETPLALYFQGQDASGSAENTIFRILANCIDYIEFPSLLLLCGDRLLSDAGKMNYILRVVRANSQKILRVFQDTGEFRLWATNGLVWPKESQLQFA